MMGQGLSKRLCINKPSATVLLEFYEFCSLKEKNNEFSHDVVLFFSFLGFNGNRNGS
jgi:hypothetical protein